MECLENSKVASVMLMELNMIWFSSGLDSKPMWSQERN